MVSQGMVSAKTTYVDFCCSLAVYFLVCFADVIPRTDFLNDSVVAESFASTAQRLTSQSSGKGDPPVVFLPPIFALLTRESMSARARARISK